MTRILLPGSSVVVGLPMDQLYALEAVKAKAIGDGISINSLSELKPPVLG